MIENKTPRTLQQATVVRGFLSRRGLTGDIEGGSGLNVFVDGLVVVDAPEALPVIGFHVIDAIAFDHGDPTAAYANQSGDISPDFGIVVALDLLCDEGGDTILVHDVLDDLGIVLDQDTLAVLDLDLDRSVVADYHPQVSDRGRPGQRDDDRYDGDEAQQGDENPVDALHGESFR